MQCTTCGHINSADAKFCSQCGNALSITCGSCATANEPGSRFCKECGTALTASPVQPAPAQRDQPETEDLERYVPPELLRRIRAARVHGAMRGERRTVSMLFADIQGSTAAAETMDPEDWAEIINGAFEHLIAPIYRYEGTLARLQGDAILAFFGAPIAHEDDPVRAVRAGLDIVVAIQEYADGVVRRTGVPIAVRVGVNTGLVVVGEVGSDLRVEYTALGDAINIAARMEQTAAPGTVRVTRDTAALLQGMFELVDIGGVEVKGKAEPVQAFEVVRPIPAAAGQHPSTPLVGRDADARALLESLAGVRDGIGSICALVGEAGLGKTRLLAELRGELSLRGGVAGHAAEDEADLAWMEGCSRSFDTGVPYATFADLLRRWWGLESGEPPGWQEISESVRRLEVELDPDVPALLATILGAAIPDEHARLISALETPVLHQRVTDSVLAYIEAEADRRPVVMVLDDVHWGDSLSLALVDRLMATTETAALALVLAMRPYRDDASWRLVETAARDYGHRAVTVELAPLSPAATDELLQQLLGADAVDDDVRRRIQQRADGNPLFVEQLVASWSGHDDTAPTVVPGSTDVPTSLSGLLTARLDQLDDQARSVAQIASVVGDEFDVAELEAMSGEVQSWSEAITSLVRSGIVVERRRKPTPQYAFRHALMQDAAYSTTLLRTRRELHERLAAFLESTQPEAAQDIARHYVAADQRAKAFPHLVAAGERATRSMALLDAIQLFTAAIDAMPADADPGIVVRAHDGLGDAYGLIPNLPEATSAYQRLRDYGRACARPAIEVTALNRLGMATATGSGDLPRAEQYLDEARRIAEEHGDDLGLAEYHMNSCMIASLQGNLEAAIEHDEQTVRLGASQGSPQIRFAGVMRRALNLLATAQFEDGEVALEEAIEAADEIEATEYGIVLRSYGRSHLLHRDGDLVGARALLAEAVPAMSRFGSFYSPVIQVNLADIDLALGDIEGALTEAAETRRLSAQRQQAFTDGSGAACMARVYALCGMTQEHEQARGEALATLGPPFGDYLATTLWRVLAYANLARGALSEAAQDFAHGLTVSSTTRYWERPALLAGAALATVDVPSARAARSGLDEAEAFVADRRIAAYDGDLAHATGWLALLEGDHATARAALDRAATIAQEQGRRLLQRDVLVTQMRLAQAQGRDPAPERDRALRVSEVMAATIVDEQMRQGFNARSAQLVAGSAEQRQVSGQPR